jgi:hypothetical protein
MRPVLRMLEQQTAGAASPMLWIDAAAGLACLGAPPLASPPLHTLLSAAAASGGGRAPSGSRRLAAGWRIIMVAGQLGVLLSRPAPAPAAWAAA